MANPPVHQKVIVVGRWLQPRQVPSLHHHVGAKATDLRAQTITTVIASEAWRSREPPRQHNESDQRLLRIGTFISSGLISRISSGTPQAKAGSTLILKWYMLCMA